MKYLLDSNVVIDILRDDAGVTTRYETESKNGNEILTCPIVYYEIIRGFEISNASKKLDKFLDYFNDWRDLPLDVAVMEKAAEIYVALHRGRQIEDNDIYIAATAIVNGCTLVTANDKHFSRIDGLKVENWR